MGMNIPVFVASPSDVPKERQYAIKAIDDVNRKLHQLYGVTLVPVAWEQFSPLTSKHGSKRFQDVINVRLEKCGIFIGILYRRYGTEIDSRRTYSGTEAEFRTAIRNRRRISILSYFRESDYGESKDRTKSQTTKLQDLKNKLRNAGIVHQPYSTPVEFRDRISLDLMETAIGIIEDVSRRDSLRNFFKLGLDHHRNEPSVMIGYPAIHKHQFPLAKTDRPWRKRLLPNVIYEDFKAIQKLEAALRHIGVTDYSSVTLDNPRLRQDPGNRIWLCLPRNPMARAHLDQLENRARFAFVKHGSENRILWRPSASGQRIEVRSPLGLYLNAQRPRGHTAWDPDLGNIVCKDFAVISRFASPVGKFGVRGTDPFYHYFMAGIRGLGTWGVGWFVDRCVDQLSRLPSRAGNTSEDVQALLEVTFENFRIVNVRDVSTQKRRYFDQEMNPKYVFQQVQTFKKSQGYE